MGLNPGLNRGMRKASRKKTVVVTRPDEEGKRLACLLRLAGYHVIRAPVLRMRFYDGIVFPRLSSYQALLFTSVRAVRGFARLSEERRLPVFTVGDKTAESALSLGFQTVTSAGGDGRALEKLVAESCAPEAGPLLHPSGEQIAVPLGNWLQGCGFAYERVPLYTAEAVDKLPPLCVKAIGVFRVYAVLLYSPRSARVFAESCAQVLRTTSRRGRRCSQNRAEIRTKPQMELRAGVMSAVPVQRGTLGTGLARIGLTTGWRKNWMRVLCLSPKVADALRAGFEARRLNPVLLNIEVAAFPTEKQMLNQLKEM